MLNPKDDLAFYWFMTELEKRQQEEQRKQQEEEEQRQAATNYKPGK